jgi:hypothetical protein
MVKREWQRTWYRAAARRDHGYIAAIALDEIDVRGLLGRAFRAP